MKFFIQFFLCGILTGLVFPPFFLIPIGFIVFPYLFCLVQKKEFIHLHYNYHFISGFLYGLCQNKELAECGHMASVAAAEIISHYGARPLIKLSNLV